MLVKNVVHHHLGATAVRRRDTGQRCSSLVIVGHSLRHHAASRYSPLQLDYMFMNDKDFLYDPDYKTWKQKT